MVNEGENCPREDSSKFRQYLAATTANLSALCMGVCLSWTSSALPMLQSPNSRISISPEEGSWIGSLLTLGAFAGAIPAGRMASIMGPKRTLQLLAFPLFASWIIIAYCGTIYGLYVARFLAGIACGAICVAAPSYVAEIADAKVRGTLGALFQLQITCGLLIGYLLGALVDDFILLALIPGVIPVVYLTCLVFMPESPVYLCSKGDTDLAVMSLRWFGRDGGPGDPLLIGSAATNTNSHAEISRIMEEIRAADLAGGAGFWNLLKSKASSRALLISMGLMVFQQLSGINAVLFYTGNIFRDSGSTLPPENCAIIIGFVQVVATYGSTLLVDRAGRRILLVLSSSVMSLCLISLGVYFHMKTIGDVSPYTFVPVASLAIFIVVFSIGFGPIPWIMLGELFNPLLKGTAMSISASFNWILAFAVTKLFQNFLDAFGSALTFGSFGIVCVFATVFSVFAVPETKGKDLDEITAILEGTRGKRTKDKAVMYGADIEIKKVNV